MRCSPRVPIPPTITPLRPTFALSCWLRAGSLPALRLTGGRVLVAGVRGEVTLILKAMKVSAGCCLGGRRGVSPLPRTTILAASVSVLAAAALALLAAPSAGGLPDARAYELVSPPEESAVAPYAAVPSSSGEAVDFQARGAFAGASSGSLNLYQARRTASGWRTAPLTPAPSSPLGPLEEQVPLFYSPDLSQTIFTTPESYAP